MHPDPAAWTVIVTGGASGLGSAVVDRLLAGGVDVVVLDRTPPSSDARFVEVDLADRRTAEAAVAAVVADRGHLDAVVTCAGIDRPGRLDDVDPDVWEQVVAVNLLGTVAVVRAALAALAERRGRVLTIASTLGHRGVSDATAYCASKFGIVGFTRALMVELQGQVGVTLLTPGGMDTAFFDGRDPQYRPPPDARLADPAAVAETVWFALCRPDDLEVRELVVCGPFEGTWP